MHNAIEPGLAQRIRLVVFDVDGVFTDGGVYIGADSTGTAMELKRFDITDGLGVKMLARAGLHVALVSGRYSAASRVRAKELGVELIQDVGARKVPVIAQLLDRHGLEWADVAFLSDDLADLPALDRVGLPAAVANAVPEVRAIARVVTQRRGGEGAVREFSEMLLRSRGQWSGLVKAYREEAEQGQSRDRHE